jgi:adenylate kinase
VRAVVFGQSGLDKDDYLRKVLACAREAGRDFEIINLGEKMFERDHEGRDPKLYPTLPETEREMLRRWAQESVLNDVDREPEKHYLLNAHAVFRTDTGMTPSADIKFLSKFSPDVIIVLIDDFHYIHRRLRGTPSERLSFSNILEWRDAEIFGAKMIAQQLFQGSRSPSDRRDWKFFIIARGHDPRLIFRLLYGREQHVRIYSSFAITGASAEENARIDAFKQRLANRYIVFDPYKIVERGVLSFAESLLEEIAESLLRLSKRIRHWLTR